MRLNKALKVSLLVGKIGWNLFFKFHRLANLYRVYIIFLGKNDKFICNLQKFAKLFLRNEPFTLH